MTLFARMAAATFLCASGCSVDADLDGLPCPCIEGYRCIEDTCLPDPLIEDESLVSWSGVVSGGLTRPTIHIHDSIYPAQPGVRFFINGSIDVRDPERRTNGYDPTGPKEGSEFHLFPDITLAVGDELEAHWRDAQGNVYASVAVAMPSP